MNQLTTGKRGTFIVLDGCEGTGKSTILRALKEVLSEKNTVFTREPGGTPIAEHLRNLLLIPGMAIGNVAEYMLFWASRAEHVERIIRPALLSGKNVISDRFDSSTFAYQVWARRNFSLIPTFGMMRELICGDSLPNLYIYLDLDPEIGFQRIGARGSKDRIEAEDFSFHKRAREGYQFFFREQRHRHVDASKSLEEVVNEVLVCVQETFDIPPPPA